MIEILPSQWPLVLGILGLAVAWGEARFKIADLRERLRRVEKEAAEDRKQVQASLKQIELDVREITTVLRVKEDHPIGGV